MSDQVLIGRDWSEDFEHENGNYMCLCTACGNTFVGYKRRTTCKLCAQPEPTDGVDVMAPDFSLDGGSQPCYYAETVERITAAHQAEVARLRGEVERLDKARDNQFETLCKMSLELDRANALLRSISPHIARAPEVGYLLGVIDAHLAQQAKS